MDMTIPRFATGPALSSRTLLNRDQGEKLRELFGLLANKTRLRLIHALEREEVMCVGDLASTLGMKPQAVSNQLQRLAEHGIVKSSREGLRIYYRIADPCIVTILDHACCLVECADKNEEVHAKVEARL